jgi:amino acid transporter
MSQEPPDEDRTPSSPREVSRSARRARGAAGDQRALMRGAQPGTNYVRITVPSTQTLRWRGQEGVLVAPEEPPSPRPTAPPSDGVAAPPETDRGRAAPAAGEVVLPGVERRATLVGHQPGTRYVRRYVPSATDFRARGGGTVEATEAMLAPRSPLGRLSDRARLLLIGRRLSTAEEINERLTKVKALAVLSSDAISSVAYATEASLGILILAGASILRLNLPIAGAIALLMVIVGFSYRQTIHAYPHGGGSYIVARDNLGDLPGLIAAAALLIDYVLTVSVSIAAGVDALTSAIAWLHPYQIWLGLACIALIMLGNLRGIRESGSIFAAPTYLFITCFLIMIGTGVIHAMLSPGGLFTPILPTKTPQQLGWESGQLGIVLILTAFASGCSAMTGVEAISNGVPAFKKPESDNAARTLVWMIAVLATLYVGVTYLAWRFGIEPNASQYPTLDSQIAALLFHGPFTWFYYLIQFATLIILVLAANTSYADFPRLSSILARDGFLPHQFAYRGDRLAFNTGIMVLTVLSAVLLVVFRGNTDALINLYALGVFTAFTLSQTGMVFRWLRLRDQAGPGWRRSMTINLIGACATGVVAAVITATKFDRGAWIVAILVPLFVLLFQGISKHYLGIQHQLSAVSSLPVETLARANHIMIVPLAELNRPAVRGLAYACSLTSHVIAIHVVTSSEEATAFRAAWKQWIVSGQDQTAARSLEPHLVIIESPYRNLIQPLVAYIDALRDANPDAAISVILPEFVVAHWWERVLHNQTALRLKLKLYSDPGVTVVNIPYHVARAGEP